MKESHGDWPSVPCQSKLQAKLNSAFHVEGIPTVVVVKVSDGTIITKGGKEKIEEHGSSAFAQWEWDHADEDEVQPTPALQSGSNVDESSKAVQGMEFKMRRSKFSCILGIILAPVKWNSYLFREWMVRAFM